MSIGLIFLRFVEVRFAAQRAKLDKAGASSRPGSRVDEPAAYHADNVRYLAPEARFDFLLTLPERADVGAKVNAAMREVEKHNPQLAGVLPKTFNLFTGTLLKELLKKISEIPATLDFDAFGRTTWPENRLPTRATRVPACPQGCEWPPRRTSWHYEPLALFTVRVSD